MAKHRSDVPFRRRHLETWARTNDWQRLPAFSVLRSAPRSVFDRSVHRYGLLILQQRALQLGSPTVAGNRAVAPDDAMTRDAECDGVRRARARHRSDRLRLADT